MATDDSNFLIGNQAFKIPGEILEKAIAKLTGYHATVNFFVLLHRINIKAAIGPTEQDVELFCDRVYD